jgi:hypothetical protein
VQFFFAIFSHVIFYFSRFFAVQLLTSVSFSSCSILLLLAVFYLLDFFSVQLFDICKKKFMQFLTYEIFSRVAWCPWFEASFAMCILYCNFHTGTNQPTIQQCFSLATNQQTVLLAMTY